jgi:hypothetical protein
MYFCYVDEAGCTGALPSAGSPIQPVFALVGLAVEHSHIAGLTRDFLKLKQRFFPGLMANAPHYLDRVLQEVKGSELRADVRSTSRRRQRAAIGFLDNLLRLVEASDARIFGRVLVKGIGDQINSRSIYTASTQAVCRYFQEFLGSRSDDGAIIADSRTKTQNARVSHSIFTRKFKATGDDYDRILEMPTFGHSENHAVLQIVDAICSGLVFPMATHAYCLGRITSVHVSANFGRLRTRFGERLMRLQFRYQDGDSRWRGGLTMNDALGHRSGSFLFRPAD